MSGPFLPDRLRPRTARRRARPSLALLLAAGVLPLAVPLWRLRTVDVQACPGLPSEAVASLESLEGRFALAIDPRRLRSQLEAWPGVARVDVRLDLPATLKVRAVPALPHGSVAAGRHWRAVAEDGRLAGPLDQPWRPLLQGFTSDPTDLRRGLEVARRLGAASGDEVEAVRRITPADYEVRLRRAPDGAEVTVWVGRAATAGERYWCERVARGLEAAGWADLRQADRVVLGGGR